jgi:hypothetical protein
MVTDQQVKRLWRLRQRKLSLEVVAAKAGMDAKYLRDRQLPSEMKQKHLWRTRPDPFEEVWPELRERLTLEPGLQAKTLFEYLQRTYPGRFTDGQLRTLQRHLKHWRATEGPAREVFFAREHRPGELCDSDFTHCRELGITIGGEPFPHLLYHFVLSYSNWETGMVCFSESFESLSEGLQGALWELGGVPREHRSDRMSAAVNNLTDLTEFRAAYAGLLKHYGIEGQKIQAGHAHENGDIEQRHYRLKQAIAQGLMLRASRDFQSLAEYEKFLRDLFARLNAGRRLRFAEELAQLRPLPERRLDTTRRERVRVTPGSLIHVHRNTYSVHSRLIGEIVDARVKPDSVEIWYRDRKMEELPRLRGRGKHRIDYRHIIDWLVRKPGAFDNYRYRQDLFPTSWFRMAYDILREQLGPKRGAKEYLEILTLAAGNSEAKVEEAVRFTFSKGPEQLTAATIRRLIEAAGPRTALPTGEVEPVPLTVFDELLTGNEAAA